MPPTLKAGQDVTALMSAAPAPPTSGQDVTALMSAAPTFWNTARDCSSQPSPSAICPETHTRVLVEGMRATWL